MADKTKIEWCEATWSPVTGCTPVSEGCKNCYAAGIAKRFWGDRKFSDVRFHEDRLMIPSKWKKPRKIFVCSMSDLFHPAISHRQRNWIFEEMALASQHIFILLTKRPEIAVKYDRWREDSWLGYPYSPWQPNVWMGATCENQKTADERIPILLDIPAAVRFVSIEPMLSEVDIIGSIYRAGRFPESEGLGISWVIAGCESGPKRRPTKINWIRKLRDQCIGNDIPFFLKQIEIDRQVVKVPKLDGVVWNQHPE